MSTTFYLECLDHDPVLSSDEVGQHSYNLPTIRSDISNRELFSSLANADLWPDWGHHFRSNAISFLIRHPHCRIGIRDEYGKDYPLVDEKDE